VTEDTVVGSAASAPALSAVGAVATASALVLFLRTVGGGRSGRDSHGRGLLVVYRTVILIVLVSTPISLVLAWVRHG
jgi:hypothetical protein